MDQPQPPSTRKPILPSQGGLLGRGFVYRSATQTDVRLTWAQAKAGQGLPSDPEHSADASEGSRQVAGDA